jgi:hypothetical protein
MPQDPFSRMQPAPGAFQNPEAQQLERLAAMQQQQQQPGLQQQAAFPPGMEPTGMPKEELENNPQYLEAEIARMSAILERIRRGSMR